MVIRAFVPVQSDRVAWQLDDLDDVKEKMAQKDSILTSFSPYFNSYSDGNSGLVHLRA